MTGRTLRSALGAIAVIGITFTLGGEASAQVVQGSGQDEAQLQVGFNGVIAGTIQLSIVATGPTTLTSESSVMGPAHSSATIDFGSFTTTQPSSSTNADAYRVTLGTRGAVLAARLISTLTYNGSATGSITVSRLNLAGAAPDVPLANLRIASPPLASWTAGTNGTQVPNAGAAGYNVCTAAGALTCVTGTGYEHQLAVFVPDAQPAGPFTTVVVYTGTAP